MLRCHVFTTLNLVAGTLSMLKMIMIVILLKVFQSTYMHAVMLRSCMDVYVELVVMRSYRYKKLISTSFSNDDLMAACTCRILVAS